METFVQDKQQFRELLKNVMGNLKDLHVNDKSTQGTEEANPEVITREQLLEKSFLAFLMQLEKDGMRKQSSENNSLSLPVTQALVFLIVGCVISVLLGTISNFWLDLGLLLIGLGSVQAVWLAIEKGCTHLGRKNPMLSNPHYWVFRVGFLSGLLSSSKEKSGSDSKDGDAASESTESNNNVDNNNS